MPCLVGCLAMFFPRLAIIIVWLASDYLQTAYQTVLWPVLGFILMPMTTLAYAFAWHNGNGSPTGSTLGAIVLVLGVLFDLGIISGNASNKQARRAMAGRKGGRRSAASLRDAGVGHASVAGLPGCALRGRLGFGN